MTKNIELPVVSKSVGGLSRESLETLAAVEASLTAQDTTEADRLNYKNAVEEYIYDIRDKVMLPELHIQIIFFSEGLEVLKEIGTRTIIGASGNKKKRTRANFFQDHNISIAMIRGNIINVYSTPALTK